MDKKTEALKLARSEHQCKYPNCPYPCPDLPDCRDAEQPARYATTIGEGNLSANGFEGDWFKKPAQPSNPLTRDELRHMYQNSTAWQFYCDVDERLFGRPANSKGDA